MLKLPFSFSEAEKLPLEGGINTKRKSHFGLWLFPG